MTDPRTPIKSLHFEEIEARLGALGQPGYRAKQVAEWIFGRRAKAFEGMSNLPAALRRQLADEFVFDNLEPVRVLGSEDTTRKFLFRLADGELIESVLIPASPALYGEASDRRTICISTQVGCAYGCKFCASGLDGWRRNLHAGEIVEQVLRVEELSGEKINNIVFMGMGEPLANFDESDAGDRDPQCAVGRRPRRAAHHDLDERSRAADPATRRAAAPGAARHFAARCDRRGAGADHAGEPQISARGRCWKPARFTPSGRSSG